METEAIKEILRAELKPSRYQHTLGVIETADELAALHGQDRERARLAALLHDNAKALPPERMREIAAEAALVLGEGEDASAALLHAAVGAHLARARFGVSDTQVLDAIRYHTTGRADMSALEAIIYIADMIEPYRPGYDGIDELRELARRDLFAALELGLWQSNSYVEQRGQKLFERSAQAHVWVQQRNMQKCNQEE